MSSTVLIPQSEGPASKGGRRAPSWADAAALAALLLLTLPAVWRLTWNGTMLGQDTATQFYPWFEYLGSALRSGDIPMWNPHAFSGTPFLADPQSGWMYLPAMLLFTVLPLSLAAKAYIVLHLLLGGFGTYALARAWKMPPHAALLAGGAYLYSGLLYTNSACCPNHTGVAAWWPLVLLGVELAIAAPSWPGRLFWWGVCGLALSQVMAIWLGQGTYYVLLGLGGYVLYRTVLSPDAPFGGRRRGVDLVTHGAAVLTLGAGMAAAGIIPRVRFQQLSNLSAGYTGIEANAGWTVGNWPLLWTQSRWYVGGALLMLALAAPFLAGRRFGVPYWAVLAAASLVLSLAHRTPLHWVMFRLLPGFEQLHVHESSRVMLVFYLAAAMLAASTVSALPELHPRWVAVPAVGPLLVLVLLALGTPVALTAAVAAVAASLLLTFALLLPPVRPLIALLLVVVVVADNFRVTDGFVVRSTRVSAQSGAHAFRKLDVDAYYAPGPAGRFLMQRSRAGEPFRFFGYDPRGPRLVSYPPRWAFPPAGSLLVNNRAILYGLQDVQGYDPLRLRWYDQYMTALNGRPQAYRSANVQPGGTASPLLDLLNVRYVVVSSSLQTGQPDVQALLSTSAVVYEEGGVRVLERRTALPRAWLVHSVGQAPPGEQLSRLRSASFDAARTALVERVPAGLAPPPAGQPETVDVTSYTADRVLLTVRAAAPALLVMSEVYYPDWKAAVDGRSAEVLRADYLFRAVAVPAGAHTVELTYPSTTLLPGLLISGLSWLLLLGAGVWAARRSFVGARGRLI